MTLLHNRVSQKELKERLIAKKEARLTLSFYKYFPIRDPKNFRDRLYGSLHNIGVYGRIYVAKEGINGQVSVPSSRIVEFKARLFALGPFGDIIMNEALNEDGNSFWVLKIKVRDRIVADGIKDPGFDMSRKGKYLDAAEFNRLTDDPETIVVDMRNHYEYEVGHFVNALEVPSDTFREQLPMVVEMMKEKKEKNIIMYCTGGIRCEKASAYLMHHGFRHVYHLHGGVLRYARTVRESGLPNKFRGKNFVFDNRLGERVSDEVIASCHQCGKPADTHTNCKNDACHLLFIQCQECSVRYDGCCSPECQQVAKLPEKERKELRKGKKNGMMVFHKSRHRTKASAGPGPKVAGFGT